MLLLTAGLAAWVLLHERRGPPPNLGGHLLFDYSARVAETGSAVIDLNPDDATAIDLRTASGQVSLRRRADGVWDLSKPIRDRADPALVRQLLEFCRSARIAETLDRDEIRRGRVSAESVGLDDKSAWRLSWRNAAGSEIADIRIGRTAPLGNAAYITVEGERRRPDVYVVTPDLRTLLARPADGFRDPRVTRFSADEVVRAAVRKGEGEVEFSRARAPQKITVRAQDGKPREELDEGTPWFISRPLLNAPASQAAVKDFISMICGAQVSGWLPATDATGGAPEEKPLVEVTLSGPEQSRPDVLSFFADPAGGESVICRSRLRRCSFKVPRQIADDILLAEDPDNFRDTQLASMEPGLVHSLRVELLEGDSVELRRVGSKWSWRPLPEGPWNDAAGERVESLVKAVNDSEILAFVEDSLADPAKYALDKPAFSLRFGVDPNPSLASPAALTPTSSVHLRIGITPDRRVYANFEGTPFVYSIRPELAYAIPQRTQKWRSLALPGWTLRQVRSIRLTSGSEPPVSLRMDPLTFRWTAERAGRDVTDLLLPAAAEALANRAGSLQAGNWLADGPAAAAALERAALTVEVVHEVYDEQPGASHEETTRLELALMPAGPTAPFCYGRMTGVSDPFLIDTRVFHELSLPVLRPANPAATGGN